MGIITLTLRLSLIALVLYTIEYLMDAHKTTIVLYSINSLNFTSSLLRIVQSFRGQPFAINTFLTISGTEKCAL